MGYENCLITLYDDEKQTTDDKEPIIPTNYGYVDVNCSSLCLTYEDFIKYSPAWLGLIGLLIELLVEPYSEQ